MTKREKAISIKESVLDALQIASLGDDGCLWHSPSDVAYMIYGLKLNSEGYDAVREALVSLSKDRKVQTQWGTLPVMYRDLHVMDKVKSPSGEKAGSL